jgi:CHAT domain-containing protein/tetratricopeptide (TPR) repeat protein
MPPFPANATTQDSIRLLIDGEYEPAAEALAARVLASAERLHGPRSRAIISPLLDLAEARSLGEGEARREGFAILDRAERIGRSRGIDPVEQAAIERIRGIAYRHDDQFDSAAVCLERSRAILEKSVGKENVDYGRTLIWQGMTIWGQRRVVDAAPLMKEAAAIFERVVGKDHFLCFHALERLATSPDNVYPVGTLEVMKRAIDGQRRFVGPNAPCLMRGYWKLANLYLETGRLAEAKRMHEQSMEILAANPPDAQITPAYAYESGAFIAQQEGDHARAVELFSKVLEVVVQARGEHAPITVWSRDTRAGSLFALGRIAEAERDWLVNRPIVQSKWGVGSEMDAANEQVLGECALARGDTTRARELLVASSEHMRAYRRAEYAYLPSLEFGSADEAIALCHWLAGRKQDAFDLAVMIEVERTKNVRRIARTLGDRDAAGIVSNPHESLGLALTALLSGDLDESSARRGFDAIVRSRAIVLDAVTARNLSARLSADSTTRVLVDSLQAVERRITSGARRKADPDAVALDDRRRALTAALARARPELARSFEGGGIGVDQVQDALSRMRGSRLVSYVRFLRRDEEAGSARNRQATTPWYAAFVVESGTSAVRVVDVGSAVELDAMIDRWRTAVTGGASAAWTAVGDTLRDRLWDRLGLKSHREAIHFVVADGDIALLPIVSLPASGGAYLIDRLGPMTYLSAERDLAAHREGLSRGTGLLVLGDPDFELARCANSVDFDRSRDSDPRPTGELPPAPLAFRGKTSNCEEFRNLRFSRVAESGAEARDIAALSPHGGRLAVLVGQEASEESFKRFAPGHQVIHVASHGFALSDHCLAELGSRETPLVRAGIVLAGANARAEAGADREDGILTAEEISALDMTGTDCVVLSACESGLGEIVTSEGVMGMRRAFHQAGAATLVSSLWKVDDASARTWMREFYRGLFGNHLDPAEAAHEASLALVRRLRKAGRDPSPSQWGAFVVSGAVRN